MSAIKVSTAFNIHLEFTAAPFHKRLFAWLLDVVVLLLYAIGAFKLVWLLTSANAPFAVSKETIWVLMMILMIPFFTYHVVCEIVLNGQSIGKRIMRLQVVTEKGGRPGIGQFIIRWVIRTSDYMVVVIAIYAPIGFGGNARFFWQVAAAFGLLVADIILVNTSKKNQRLGDILAHTILISTSEKAAIEDTIFLEVDEHYAPTFSQVMALSDRDINSLKSILDAAKKQGDYNLAERASEKLKAHLKIETQLSPFEFLEVLLKDYNHLSAA